MNLERLAVSRVSQRRTVRLIANANHKPPVLEKLASSYGARAHLEALESVTNARQIVQQKGIPGLAPEALASGYGFTYINAALADTRPGGNRFNPPAWGVWYCAFDCETSLQEAAFHMTRALQAAGGDFDNEIRYIELSQISRRTLSICGIRIQYPTVFTRTSRSAIRQVRNWPTKSARAVTTDWFIQPFATPMAWASPLFGRA